MLSECCYSVVKNFFMFLLFESFDDVKELSCYWQEDGGSVLTNRFMTIAGQKHAVLKFSKSIFNIFVKKFSCILRVSCSFVISNCQLSTINYQFSNSVRWLRSV